MTRPEARSDTAANRARLPAPPSHPAADGGPTGLDRAPGWADFEEVDRFAAVVGRYLAGELDPAATRYDHR
jgi:hypothetical protein